MAIFRVLSCIGDFSLNYDFAIITQPGFETELALELAEIWPLLISLDGQPTTEPLPEFKVEKGRITAAMPLYLGLQLNFFSRLASRVLIRIVDRKVRNQSEVMACLKGLDWKTYFLDAKKIGVQIDLKSPLVNNEKWLRQILFSGERFVNEKPFDAIVLLNGSRLVVSLNSSGVHLHKRGILKHRGGAPLRETIAHFCLRRLMASLPESEKKHLLLFDPMMGSGTFLAEALLTQKTPHLGREFAFQDWKICPKLFKLGTPFATNYKHPTRKLFTEFGGADVSSEAVASTRENIQALDFASAHLKLSQQDFLAEDWRNLFRQNYSSVPLQKRLMITNPPYNERMQMKDSKFKTGPWQMQMLENLRLFGRAAILWPKDRWRDWDRLQSSAGTSQNLPEYEFCNVGNQGIDCELRIFKQSAENFAAK